MLYIRYTKAKRHFLNNGARNADKKVYNIHSNVCQIQHHFFECVWIKNTQLELSHLISVLFYVNLI